MKITHEWMKEDGELNLISKSQRKLAQSTTGQHVLLQYGLFKANGLTTYAQEIRDNVNNAMELAYEQDTNAIQIEKVDLGNTGFGF